MTVQGSGGLGLVLSGLLLVSGCSSNADKPEAAGTARRAREDQVGPRLVLTETSFDLGEVDYSRPYKHAFAVSNSGDQPLRLTLTRKSCKCAGVEVPEQEIPPGGEAQVTILWVPIPGQYGAYTLAADLESNDPQQPRFRLEVKGQFNPSVRIWPEEWAEVDFHQIQPGQVLERELKVFSTRLAAFDLQANASHPGLKVTLRKLPEGAQVGDHVARSGYVVTMKTSPELPKGYFRDNLTLKVHADEGREIIMPIYGEVESGALRVVPREIEFKKNRIMEADSQKVQVQFLVPSDADRVDVLRYEPAFLVVEKPALLRRGLWQFVVRIPGDHPEAAKLQAGGFVEGMVILKTTASSAPEFPIRVKWTRSDRDS